MNRVNYLQNIKSDIPASIVVFFVAIPLCLGIALASGAPLFSGIIAGIIGGILVGLISGSRQGPQTKSKPDQLQGDAQDLRTSMSHRRP